MVDQRAARRSGSFTGVVGRITFVDIIPGIVTSGAILPGPDGATDFFYIGQLNRGGGQGQSP
jgi:hypothetical protein